jgi:hypothetical protein
MVGGTDDNHNGDTNILLYSREIVMADFVLGFKTLADLIPDIVGEPLEDERHNPENGDGLQQTTSGLMVWRKADNWTAFTNGWETWVNGPFGLQKRLNNQLFDWEKKAQGPVVVSIVDMLPVAPWNELEMRSVAEIEMVVVHWDGDTAIAEDYDPYTYYQWEARYHIAKDWGYGARGYGLMYGEVIDRTGKVWITRPVNHVVWAQTLANRIGYAIKLDASSKTPPTQAQMNSLRYRLDARREQFKLPRSAVFGHGELGQYGNSTACPGPDILRFVRDYRS